MLKRIAYILLSAVMAVSLCAPALAAEAGGGGDGDGPYIGCGIGALKDTGETTTDKSEYTGQDESGQEAVTPVEFTADAADEGYDSDNPDAYIPDGAVIPEQETTGVSNEDSDYATLLINQSFLTFLEDDDFTTVYQVSAYKDGSLAYSNTIGFDVASPDKQTVRIAQKIPAGSDVKIELVYAGPHYQLCDRHTNLLEFEDIPGGIETVASFSLVYNFANVYGSGAINHFHVPADESLRVPMSGEMPKTGGIGTLLIYAAGIAMVAIFAHAYRRRRGKLFQIVVSLALTAGMLSGLTAPAYAYFTDTDSAISSAPVALKCKTKLVEEVSDFTKKVYVSASDDSCASQVRINAWAPDGYSLSFSFDKETGYLDSDGWFWAVIA